MKKREDRESYLTTQKTIFNNIWEVARMEGSNKEQILEDYLTTQAKLFNKITNSPTSDEK